MASENVKSRREKRKEARLEKKQSKHQSWIENQKVRIQKKKPTSMKIKSLNKSNALPSSLSENSSSLLLRGESESGSDSERDPIVEKKNEVKIQFRKPLKVEGKGKSSKSSKRKSKTKFEEFLEMTTPSVALSAEEDLELERRLAKKLKVKGGKLPGLDDDLNDLIEGLPSLFDNLVDDEGLGAEGSCKDGSEKGFTGKKRRKGDFADDEPEKMEDDLDAGLPQHEDMSDSEAAADEPPVEKVMKQKRKKRKSKKGSGSELENGRDTEVENTLESPAMGVVVEKAPAKTLALKEELKYVAPHLRARSSNESEEHVQFRRRVQGLLNRMSESNIESITGEMSTIFHSISRSFTSQIISEGIISFCSRGARGNEQHAAVTAAFVAGMACSVGIDFSARLMASLAKSFQDEYNKEDNLSLRNLTLLLSYLCIFGVCSSDLIYDFLMMLSKRLTEVDVSTILTVLQCCGMKIRGDDPASMKNFILSVQNKVNELKSAHGGGEEKINGRRMEFMLETICDIKNNKKRPKEDSAQHTRIKKWLQKLKVEDILIRGLTWSKLLDPDKKGQWWLSGDMASTAYNVEEVASTIDKEVTEAQKMLQLASSQRMNTDARRAIFCIIMSGEDYIDAFEKLLRLDLPGKQDREIMRVLVECCLQEKVFNKYYAVLASKLCEHEKNHKFTLQFCLWDHFKELESMHLTRSMHLAKFVAEMVVSYSLSIAVLKIIDFTDPVQLTPKKIIHFRMLFEAIFEHSDKIVWNIFTRVAVSPDLETLRNGIEFFVKEYVVKSNKDISNKFKVARKALNNVEGVLM